MTYGKNPEVPSIDEVRSRFVRWRRTRRGKTPIPEELWSAAAAVARRDGVNPTAVALHLDGGKLKRRMSASRRPARTASPPTAAFVELLAPGQAQSGSTLPQYTLELEGRNGKLRIHCQAAAAAELATLSRALWDMAR
jgi:hypothetical protein